MKLLHTMLRVRDLEKSLKFYQDNFNMQLLRKKDYPKGKFTNVFIGYGNEEDNTVLELTYNWEQEEDYILGTAFGHIAISVTNIYEFCDKLKANNVIVSREPGPMKHSSTVIAFILDPDGYKIELIQI